MITIVIWSSTNLEKQKQNEKHETEITFSLRYLIMSQHFRVGYQGFSLLF